MIYQCIKTAKKYFLERITRGQNENIFKVRISRNFEVFLKEIMRYYTIYNYAKWICKGAVTAVSRTTYEQDWNIKQTALKGL